MKKTSLKIGSWLKDVAPSTELRKWFSHDPAKWNKFRSRYFDELKANPGAWQPIVEAARHGTVTLIYSSHDTKHNNAVALQDFLQRHINKQPSWRLKRSSGFTTAQINDSPGEKLCQALRATGC
jgi:uncharacterized protein YeaO (DUF488 family)